MANYEDSNGGKKTNRTWLANQILKGENIWLWTNDAMVNENEEDLEIM